MVTAGGAVMFSLLNANIRGQHTKGAVHRWTVSHSRFVETASSPVAPEAQPLEVSPCLGCTLRTCRVTGQRFRAGQLTRQPLPGSRSFIPSDAIAELAKSEDIRA